MSESSPFRTSGNHHYRWPPEPADGPFEIFERVTHVIDDGTPQGWRKAYERREMSKLLVDRAGDIVTYFLSAISETPEQFSLDQQWWNEQLDKAHQWDVDQKQKIQDWNDGLLPHLKTKPRAATSVKALLRLTPAQRFFKYFKAAADLHSGNAAQLGTNAHTFGEDLALRSANPDDYLTSVHEPSDLYDLVALRLEGRYHNELPVVVDQHIANIAEFFGRYRPIFTEIESVIYNTDYMYAGQFDGICKVPVSVMLTKTIIDPDDPQKKRRIPWTDRRDKTSPNYDPDFITVWMDWKTTVRDEIGLQIVAYVNGSFIGRADGTKDPIPHVDEFWGVEFGGKTLNVYPLTLPPFSDFIAVWHVATDWVNNHSKEVVNPRMKEIEAA